MRSAEEALESAISAVLNGDAEVLALLGDLMRLMEKTGSRPDYPYLEIARHFSEPSGAMGVEASEHRVDLVVVIRMDGGTDGVRAIAAIRDALRAYEAEMEEPFPEDPAKQLSEVLRSMARAWEGTTARLLRQAKGAPEDAGLGLVVQEMAQGIGQGISGSGVIQFIDPVTGLPLVKGRYLGQSQGRDALKKNEAIFLTQDKRGPSLEDIAPEIFADLLAHLLDLVFVVGQEVGHDLPIALVGLVLGAHLAELVEHLELHGPAHLDERPIDCSV